MKTLKNKINNLVQKSILEGGNSEQDFNLFSRIFDYYSNTGVDASNAEKQEFLKKLNNSVTKKRVAKEKIDSIDKINYLGEYISYYLFYNNLSTSFLASKTDFDEKVLQQIIENKIKFLEIEPQRLVALLLYFNLTVKNAVELMRKSVFYNYGKQSAKYSLARYSTNSGMEGKGKSMSSGVNELLYLANKKKNLNSIDAKLEQEIKLYVVNFELLYRTNAR